MLYGDDEGDCITPEHVFDVLEEDLKVGKTGRRRGEGEGGTWDPALENPKNPVAPVGCTRRLHPCAPERARSGSHLTGHLLATFSRHRPRP